MRELVYLSERKLAQFDLRKRRWLRGRAKVEGQIGLPGVGGVTVSPADSNGATNHIPSLDDVLEAIDKSDRPSRLFPDASARPGDWIRFHTLFSYTNSLGIATFLDHPKFSQKCEARGVWRLMLHGSVDGLAASRRPGMQHIGFGSAAHDLRYVLTEHGIDRRHKKGPSGEIIHYTDQRVRRALYEGKEPPFSIPNGPKKFINELCFAIENLDNRLNHEATAAWMAGYARVTAVTSWYEPWTLGEEDEPPEIGIALLATPLFVEYAAAPSTDLVLKQ